MKPGMTRIGMAQRLGGERALQAEDFIVERIDGVADEKAESTVTWSLRERAVCSRPAGLADQLLYPSSDIHMNVFKCGGKWNDPVSFLGLHLVQTAYDVGWNLFGLSMACSPSILA